MRHIKQTLLRLIEPPFHVPHWPPGTELSRLQDSAKNATTDIIPKRVALKNAVTQQLEEENVCRNS
jgi:hypothetical protein